MSLVRREFIRPQRIALVDVKREMRFVHISFILCRLFIFEFSLVLAVFVFVLECVDLS